VQQSALLDNPYADLQEELPGKKLSRSIGGPEEEQDGSRVQTLLDEEEMLDITEHSFIRIAEALLEKGRTARQVFTPFSVPEQFPDGTVLELMTPIAFLEAVKEAVGLPDLREMEAACLLRVLAKPELENAIILNELVMIMENFGVMDEFEDEDELDDYERSSDGDQKPPPYQQEASENEKETKPLKKRIKLDFSLLEDKGLKILQKLARFLLERYLHPREFFGPAIYKQLVKTKKKENHVEILQAKDFYLRLKIAGVRKTVKEFENLNRFLCLDDKFPHLMQVRRVIKALEEVAQGEQAKLQDELRKKHEAEIKKLEEDEGDIGEDEK